MQWPSVTNFLRGRLYPLHFSQCKAPSSSAFTVKKCHIHWMGAIMRSEMKFTLKEVTRNERQEKMKRWPERRQRESIVKIWGLSPWRALQLTSCGPWVDPLTSQGLCVLIGKMIQWRLKVLEDPFGFQDFLSLKVISA